ncbi:MAG: tRNA (guanine(46)-N(7))-methyltransferase TrmB [Rhizomicrobium sp.]
METLLPQLALGVLQGTDRKKWFDSPVAEVWLEIGFGAGEHLLWQAQQHPDVGIIGVEPYEAGVAKLLTKLEAARCEVHAHALSPAYLSSPIVGEVASAPLWSETEGGVCERTPSSGVPRRAASATLGEENLCVGVSHPGTGHRFSNIRVYQGDARDVIEALPDDSLSRVFILFPDPWPKKRHHKRRFIQTNTLDALARVLKPDAELRFASDDPGYVEWSLEHFFAHRAFEWVAERAQDWRTRPADWPPTRYERKALHGVPVFLRFRRRLQNGMRGRT